MENSVQAILMAGGALIAVMVLSVFIFMFRKGALLGENYELKKNTEQTQAFNAKFEVYEKRTFQNDSDSAYSFKSKGNTVYDVISCANHAFDINQKNNNDFKNGVVVEVRKQDVNINGDLTNYFYYILPIDNQPKGYFLKFPSKVTISELDLKTISHNLDVNKNNDTYKQEYFVSFNEFIKMYNNIRIVDMEYEDLVLHQKILVSSRETVYQVYFDVAGGGSDAITYSDLTGKVNKITFITKPSRSKDGEFAEDNFFTDTKYWKDIN